MTARSCAVVRPERERRLAAADARTATRVCEVVMEIADAWGIESAARLLATHWDVASGTNVAADAIDTLTGRMLRRNAVDYRAALAAVADAFMDGKTRQQLDELFAGGHRPLVLRLTNRSRFTGWFPSEAAARSRWRFDKPASLVQSATLHREHVFACLVHNDGAAEVILRPGFCPAVAEVRA